jgi:hypothetical protein
VFVARHDLGAAEEDFSGGGRGRAPQHIFPPLEFLGVIMDREMELRGDYVVSAGGLPGPGRGCRPSTHCVASQQSHRYGSGDDLVRWVSLALDWLC